MTESQTKGASLFTRVMAAAGAGFALFMTLLVIVLGVFGGEWAKNLMLYSAYVWGVLSLASYPLIKNHINGFS